MSFAPRRYAARRGLSTLIPPPVQGRRSGFTTLVKVTGKDTNTVVRPLPRQVWRLPLRAVRKVIKDRYGPPTVANIASGPQGFLESVGSALYLAPGAVLLQHAARPFRWTALVRQILTKLNKAQLALATLH